MQKETLDKLLIAESDLTLGIIKLFPRTKKVTAVSVTARSQLLKMAVRCI